MRAKRHNVIKEVIIDDPDYASICGELSTLSVACKEYNRAYLTNLLPNYLGMFAAKDNRDSALLKLNEQLNHIAEQLGNSRSQEILNKVNSFSQYNTCC